MLNIGILGCGRIGQVHGKTLKGMDTARAVAVSDFLPEAANALADDLNAKVMSPEAGLRPYWAGRCRSWCVLVIGTTAGVSLCPWRAGEHAARGP